ncbi:MAG: hypothetical protein K6T78_06570 [Alicyclobacillus sp.]|nr:hypothetical protein [Alicyclobacillus sp.]
MPAPQPITAVYLLFGEEPEDFTMEPKAVVIVFRNGSFRVFSTQADHNRLRALLHQHAWPQLERGVAHRTGHYRLDSHTDEMARRGWTHAGHVPEILEALRATYAKQLFFLR